jgi:hypothetical protein
VQAGDWESVLKAAGYSNGEISLIKKSGFFAAIYVNERTGAITIAYRGITSADDLGRSIMERIGDLDIQHKAAADLASIIQQRLPRSSITLSGHGSGGELAVFAGEQTGIKQIVTFNATAPFLTRNISPTWINVGGVELQH